MKQLTIFRILTFILLPFAALFGGTGLFMLMAAFGNPQVLFSLFIMTAFVIYTFASLKFLTKSIDTGKPCKPSLRDWIRVNAFASLFLIFALLNSVWIIFFSSSDEIKKLYDQTITIQPEVGRMMNLNMYVAMMRGVGYFCLFLGVILLIHILLNFRIMKKYAHLFSAPKPE